MGGWTQHTGFAIALPLANIDTDQIIPARFMSAPRTQGYGDFLMHDLRRNSDGSLRADFPLNAHGEASVLVAGRNFGSGSSREAAVYALVDAGFRAVLAPGFGDIFAGNAVNNGLLPARIDEADHSRLMAELGDAPKHVTIDLQTGLVTVADLVLKFTLDESWRVKLMNGWDDIDLTQQHADQIRAFRHTRHQIASWAWPTAAD